MRWVLAAALLVTAALLAVTWEPPRRATRTPLELQDAQRRTQPRRMAEAPPDAGGGTGKEAQPTAPDADPLRVEPGQRAVQVLGSDGRPAAGIGVTFHWAGKNRADKTDAYGVARLDAQGEPARANVEGREVELIEPLTVVQIDWLVPVNVVLVDAGTGRPLEAPCRAVPTHTVPGELVFVRVTAEAPDGYVVFERFHSGSVALSAKAVLLRVPARPEARLAVRVRAADGKPAAGAVVSSAAMGADRPQFEDGPATALDGEEEEQELEFVVRDAGTQFPVRCAPAGADGLVRVRGVPFLQGERIGLVAECDSRHAWVDARLPASNDGCTAEVRLPARPNHRPLEANGAIGFGSGCGGSFRRRIGTAEAEVEVYRRDGTPASGVLVRLLGWDRSARTLGSGTASFPRLPGGVYRVMVLEPGFTRAEATFTLHAGGRTRVRLDEPPGWTARVLVLDEQEHPVPFAKLQATQAHDIAYADLADGVHDLARYTNEKGEAELARLSDGPIEVTATFGTRKAEGRAEPGDRLLILRLGAKS